MDYSQKTQDLIDRMCHIVERKDFVIDKKRAEELILKTYDLFNLMRPQKIVWCIDIFDKNYGKACDSARSARSAGSAWSAGSAGSARSAWSAGSAGSAGSAWSAWSARSAGSAGSAWNARSARSARSAGSAGSAWSAWSAGSAWNALDYDFDWYIFEFEYCQNPDKDKLPNKNDFKYLAYCDLLIKANEAGLGYMVEHEDILYCVPTPLVLIDAQNRFHSLEKPSIRWKGGAEFYYIHGANFDKGLWEKIVNKKLEALEILKLSNIEQRYIALKLFGASNLLKELKGELLDKSNRNELYGLKNIIPDKILKLLKYRCPSTGREYVKFVPYEFENADVAQAWSFGISEEEYKKVLWEV